MSSTRLVFLALLISSLCLSIQLGAAGAAGAAHSRHARDTDHDGIPNSRDRDIDGDGIPNWRDKDMDGDGIPNSRDKDMDGDGIPNWSDYDSDGSGNNRGGPLKPVPPGFFGLVAEETFTAPPAERERMLGSIASTGVRMLRQPFHWSHFEHQPGQYDFGPYDLFVAAAARHGLSLMPVLTDPPDMYSTRPAGGPLYWTYQPTSNDAFASFARALVGRYGPNGSFWAEHPEVPRLPVHAWQVWNEPNMPQYWGGHPSPEGYAAMLRTVSAGIKAADPGAEVVSAGLSFSRMAMPLKRFVRRMYRAGARGTFDSLAVHPYAPAPDLVTDLVRGARRVLQSVGDGRLPIRVTETGWATAGPANQSLVVGRKAQSQLVKATLDRFVRTRRRLGVRSVTLFNWNNLAPYGGQKDYWGLYAGLVERDGRPKPALATFTRVVRSNTRAGAPS
jgi:hypothetical protein